MAYSGTIVLAEPETAEPEGRCYINRRLAHRLDPCEFPMGEVMLMGNGRWKQFLRFVVCVAVTLLVMLIIAPKAC